ncbi:universal stress protein [Streptomyces sp. NPDC007083]|uniref:universal stress protein n=1 Tax=unclassified Streptomyces TaxID=2593676 RepID=UPI0033F5C2B1
MGPSFTVGIDGSPESAAAARWAAGTAERWESALRLVAVRTGPDGAAPDREPEGRAEAAREPEGQAEAAPKPGARAEASDVLPTVAAQLRVEHPALQINTSVLEGAAARVLTELSGDTELLVLGSRGLGAVHGFLVGSVALPVAAHARCPLVLVRDSSRADESAAPRTAEPTERASAPPAPGVVAGFDVREPAAELLEFAFAAARRWSVPLTVLHGWEPPPVYGARPLPLAATALEDVLGERAALLKQAVEPWAERYPEVAVDARAVLEQPAVLLTRAAARARLLVVGRRVRTARLGTHIGPVTHGVMHHASAPVAVVPHP